MPPQQQRVVVEVWTTGLHSLGKRSTMELFFCILVYTRYIIFVYIHIYSLEREVHYIHTVQKQFIIFTFMSVLVRRWCFSVICMITFYLWLFCNEECVLRSWLLGICEVSSQVEFVLWLNYWLLSASHHFSNKSIA